MLETDAKQSIKGRKVHGEPYSEGDLVWLYTPAVPPGQSRKLHRPWKGPYKVVERLGDATYKLQGTRGRIPQIVHFDRLKPCPPNVRLANEPRQERPPADKVVPPTLKPREQCELLEEDEDYAAPMAPPNELPAAGPVYSLHTFHSPIWCASTSRSFSTSDAGELKKKRTCMIDNHIQCIFSITVSEGCEPSYRVIISATQMY